MLLTSNMKLLGNYEKLKFREIHLMVARSRWKEVSKIWCKGKVGVVVCVYQIWSCSFSSAHKKGLYSELSYIQNYPYLPYTCAYYASRLWSGICASHCARNAEDFQGWLVYVGSFFPGLRRLRLHEEREIQISVRQNWVLGHFRAEGVVWSKLLLKFV